MFADWVDKTCESCRFAIANKCRRFPPVPTDNNCKPFGSLYPIIHYIGSTNSKAGNIYIPACSEYKPTVNEGK